jgi:hypothetical protein
MLDALAAVTPEAELPALSAAARAELAAVFPAFTRWREPLRSRPEDRLVLFDSVAKLVTQAARDRPLLIILDDLQWADGDSCLLVRHLLRHAGRGRILVLAIARNELPETHPLGETVRSLDQGDQLIRLQVGGLDQEACRELLQENRPEAGGDNPALAAQLHTDTSGNPFMVIELLRGGPNGTAPIWPGSGPVPAGLDDLVTSRLAPLGPAVRALLEAAAVSGSQFELDVTAAAAGLDETAGLDAVGMALASGLVFEAGPDDCYRFTHDIVRRTLSQLLGGARRRRLHERVADAIEERRAHRLAGLTATLAHHRCSAAERGGDVRAVRWALAAAADAAARNAFSDAVRWCRRAHDHLPAGDAELEAEVLTELGGAQAQAGESDGRSTLVDGGLQARRCGRLDLAARAALGLAELAQRRPEHREDAAALVHDVLVHVGEQEAQLPPPLWARLVAREIEIGQTGDVTQAATAAAVLRRRLDDHENPDQIQERAVLAEDLFVVAEATGDSEQRTVALHHRAMVAALVGEWPATEAALAAMTGSDSGMRRRLLEERAAALAVAQGRFAEIPPTPAGPLPLGSLAPGVLVARQWFVARWLQGRLDPSSVDAYGVDDPAQIGLVRVEQILRAIGEGDRAPARIAAHQLISQAEPLPSGDGWLHAVGLLGLAVVELDDPGLALDLCGLLAPHATLTCGAGYRSFVGTVAFHLGRLAALAGEGADAERHLTTALRQLTQLRAQPWIALAQHSLAGVLEARGRSSDRDLITALRSEARWVADQLALRELP